MKKRRANGEGTIRQRSNGLWEISILDGYKPNGKRNMKSFYGKSQKEARKKMLAYMDSKAKGIDMEANYFFPEWADIWFEHHKDNIAVTTQESYKHTLRTLKEAFRRKRIRDIKPYDVEMMLKHLYQEGRSESYLSKCRAMMFQIMNKAEANDLILKNPVRFAEKMRYRGTVKEKDAFTAEEVSILMRELPRDKIGLSIRLMLGTGMRTQELLALEPRHIEPDGSAIRIEQAINMEKGTAVVGVPKSRDSYRTIPVPPSLRDCAATLRMTDKTYIWEAGKPENPCNPSYFRKQYKEALAAIPGMRYLSPHSCRHTYVSQMQALGVDLSTIQSLVGHADLSMTKHYLHVQDGVRNDAIERFSDAFPCSNPEPEAPPPTSGKIIAFPKAASL